MDTLGWIMGLMGYALAAAAWQKTANLEVELKRRQLLDKDFERDPPEEAASDPRSWSAEKKTRVETARRKVIAASWKVALLFAIPLGLTAIILLLR